MLKTFQYIDPTIAQRIRSLEDELKKIQNSKDQIQNNSKMLPGTIEKLLRYQNECQDNTRKLLQKQKMKMVDYLDKQTSVISKSNRQRTQRASNKAGSMLNQSTKIDLSTDDARSIELTAKTSRHHRQVSSFYMPVQINTQRNQPRKCGNTKRPLMKRLKKKVQDQQKLIKMLVTWVKIYQERQRQMTLGQDDDLVQQNQRLKLQNIHLAKRCKQLQGDLGRVRQEFLQSNQKLCSKFRVFQQLQEQNSGLNLRKKELLMKSRSRSKEKQI